MCFSATASFGAAAVLIPLGVLSVRKANAQHNTSWLFGVIPLGFGIQQVIEGLLWLELGNEVSGDPRLPALGFLFFSHLFWLVWIPLACYLAESSRAKRTLFLGLLALGAIEGVAMYVPLWFNPGWLEVELIKHSIAYRMTFFFDDFISVEVLRGLYAMAVLLPLLLSSDRATQVFGVLIVISVIISAVFFSYAFISVWCYFAAMLSLYIYFVFYPVRVPLQQS